MTSWMAGVWIRNNGKARDPMTASLTHSHINWRRMARIGQRSIAGWWRRWSNTANGDCGPTSSEWRARRHVRRERLRRSRRGKRWSSGQVVRRGRRVGGWSRRVSISQGVLWRTVKDSNLAIILKGKENAANVRNLKRNRNKNKNKNKNGYNFKQFQTIVHLTWPICLTAYTYANQHNSYLTIRPIQ